MDVRCIKIIFGHKFIINYSEMMNVYKVPMDYITMVFCTWNVAVVGVVAIFWKSPLWVQQIYLVLVSAATVSSIYPIC
jgi:presenilin 1